MQWDTNVHCWEKAGDISVPLPKDLNRQATMSQAWQNAFASITAASKSSFGRSKNGKSSQSVKLELHQFLDDLSLGRVHKGKRITPLRQVKYLFALRAPLEFFNKPTTRLTLRDIENFERALVSGKLCNRLNGKPYAHNTQVDMRLLLKIFLRSRLGATRALKLTDWLDTRHQRKTPDFLKESEIERLYRYCRTSGSSVMDGLVTTNASGAFVSELMSSTGLAKPCQGPAGESATATPMRW